MRKRRNKHVSIQSNTSSFMNTYADMMTLILTFFILLFSISELDSQKFKEVISSFVEAGELKGIPGEQVIVENNSLIHEFEQIKNELVEYVAQEGLEEIVRVERINEEVILRFENILLFDPGKADIKEEGVTVLNTLGVKLKGYIQDDYHITMEGHTDNIPMHNYQFPSNWELSSARAIAVAKHYIDKMQLDADSISAEGYGEQRPIADNSLEEGRGKNRRVEVKIRAKR